MKPQTKRLIKSRFMNAFIGAAFCCSICAITIGIAQAEDINNFDTQKEISFYLYQDQIRGKSETDKIRNFLMSKNMILIHYYLYNKDSRFLKYHVKAQNILNGQIVPRRIVFPSK